MLNNNHICIVGSGIAGLTIAKLIQEQFEESTKITLIESGSYVINNSSQKLNTIKIKGAPYIGVTYGQFRVVGGNSLRWGGQMIRNLPWQLGKRDHVGLRAWPIPYDEIYKFATDVKIMMGIPFRNIRGQEEKVSNFLGIKADEYQISEWPPYAMRNFQKLIAKDLILNSNVSILTDQTVSQFMVSDLDGVKRVDGVILADSDVVVKADYFVICAGAIQTTKLLFNSIEELELNEKNLGVGFTDHLSTKVGQIDLENYKKLKNAFTPFFKGSNFYYPRMHLPQKLQEEHGLPGAFLHMQIIGENGSALENIKRLFRSIQEGNLSISDFRGVSSFVIELPYFLKLFAARFFGFHLPISSKATLELYVDVEQLPSPINQLKKTPVDAIDNDNDIYLDWAVNDDIARTIKIFVDYIDSEIFEPKKIDFQRYTSAKIKEGMVDAFHPCGGTKMGSSKDDSIVDENLKIHGVENGFILSTSVYPSSATANPTFTLLCLVVRFSKYFKSIIKK